MTHELKVENEPKERRSDFPCIYHDRMAKQIDDIHRMLTGENDPSQGLFFQSKLNTAFRLRMEGFGITALNIVIGGLVIGCAWVIVVFYQHGFIK